ncbi:MAG: hypothetical protein HOP10_06105 [Chitinophagaceae bacterium]|nr:hypothetical protein [Chitinophagaceae bacterium]
MKNKKAYREAAIKMANAICRDAIWQGDACNWTGLATEFEEERRRVFSRALPPGFYDGVAGVAFFLLQVHRYHPHPLIEKTSKGAIRQLLIADDKQMSNGFYQGRAGIIFVLKLAAEILDDRSPGKEAEKKLGSLLISVKNEKDNDIISGTAGIILYLVHHYRHEKKDNLLKAAISLGDQLIERAARSEEGLSWKTMEGVSQNLTGFAHGASGIAAALAELYAVSKEERFLSAAKEAFRYEDSFFNQHKQNWPDFRFTHPGANEAEQICSLAWCHGAPGIGMARLRAYEITGEKYFLDTAKKAAATTAKYLKQESINDYSLCHGLFGNALFLFRIAGVSKAGKFKDLVTELADRCLGQYINHNIPLPDGFITDRESPCFMQGNSGIGFFFLCLGAPASTRLFFL